MNPLLMILLQSTLNIAKAHVSNSTGGEALDTTSFILDAAKAVDQLYQDENGQPLDWRTIRHHSHLPPPGEPAATSPTAEDPTTAPEEPPE